MDGRVHDDCENVRSKTTPSRASASIAGVATSFAPYGPSVVGAERVDDDQQDVRTFRRRRRERPLHALPSEDRTEHSGDKRAQHDASGCRSGGTRYRAATRHAASKPCADEPVDHHRADQKAEVDGNPGCREQRKALAERVADDAKTTDDEPE